MPIRWYIASSSAWQIGIQTAQITFTVRDPDWQCRTYEIQLLRNEFKRHSESKVIRVRTLVQAG